MRTALIAAGAALILAACAAQKKEPPPKPFVGTKWVVQLEIPIAGEQPHLRFGDGLMEGFGSCNRLAARYVQDTVGSRFIAIGRIDRGTRGCEARSQAVESNLLQVLQGASSYTILADAMTMSGSGGSIKLKSDPPYPPDKDELEAKAREAQKEKEKK
jgi:heat shock protein HslJ